jgi:hypothetical protein
MILKTQRQHMISLRLKMKPQKNKDETSKELVSFFCFIPQTCVLYVMYLICTRTVIGTADKLVYKVTQSPLWRKLFPYWEIRH